jgi:hypothetical protein
MRKAATLGGGLPGGIQREYSDPGALGAAALCVIVENPDKSGYKYQFATFYCG